MSDPIAEKAREIVDSLDTDWHEAIGKIEAALRSQDSEAFTRGKIEGLEEAADRCLEDDAFPQDWMRARVRELRQQSQKPQENR